MESDWTRWARERCVEVQVTRMSLKRRGGIKIGDAYVFRDKSI